MTQADMTQEEKRLSEIQEGRVMATQLSPEDIEALVRRVESTAPQDARCGGVYCEQSYEEEQAPEREQPTG